MCERNNDQLPLACTSSETGEVTQACALPRIQASDLMLCRMMPNQLIHTDQGAHGVFSRRDHILSYKTSFSKLKIEIISCTFSDHNGTKTRIHKKKPEQHTHMQRLSNTLWHHEWISHEIKEEIKKYFETNENETTTTPKTMGHRQSSSNSFVHSNKGLPQERRKTSNKQSKLTSKRSMKRTKSKMSRRKQIIKFRVK